MAAHWHISESSFRDTKRRPGTFFMLCIKMCVAWQDRKWAYRCEFTRALGGNRQATCRWSEAHFFCTCVRVYWRTAEALLCYVHSTPNVPNTAFLSSGVVFNCFSFLVLWLHPICKHMWQSSCLSVWLQIKPASRKAKSHQSMSAINFSTSCELQLVSDGLSTNRLNMWIQDMQSGPERGKTYRGKWEKMTD